jgi:1-acyl-sn-glycerol-3-phosphate acyltransferase
VPVDRGGGPKTAAQVIARFVEVLKSGKPLLVFPEGTRSESGVMQPFKAGGFYAAVRGGVPVVPVVLEGTHALMKKGAFDTGDGTERLVKVKVGKPIFPLSSGKESFAVNDLRTRTHAAMSDLLRSLGGRVADAGATVAETESSALAEAAE